MAEKKETLKTVRIKIRNKQTERELFSNLNDTLFSSGIEVEFMEVSGRTETVMCG